MKQIVHEAQEGKLCPEDINEAVIRKRLSTSFLADSHGLPNDGNPDILIRTSGVLRLSDFLMWELQYSELYFCEKLWPDFDENDLIEAFKEYTRRKRRFGK